MRQKPLKKWTNWSRSFVSTAEKIIYPVTENELVSLVKKANEKGKKIKLIGSGHSCAPIARTTNGYLVSLDRYKKVITIDKTAQKITIQGGMHLKDLCRVLTRNDMAMENMGTIDAQSIAGAIATGTHGMGLSFGALDQQITAVKIITGTGNIITACKKNNTEVFQMARVHLGALGIISEVTLRCLPRKNLHIKTELLDFESFCKMMPDTTAEKYSRFWWIPHTGKVQFWSGSKTDEKATVQSGFKNWFEGIFIGNFLHELGLWLTSFYPKKIALLNKWMLRKLFAKKTRWVSDFHRAMILPIFVKQSVMEYAIPIEKTQKVLREIKTIIAKNNLNVHLPIEVRFAPASDAPMSMAYEKDVCYIGIISYKPFGKKIPHKAYFDKVHQCFEKYNGRPHWAKQHGYTAEKLRTLYPRYKDFKRVKNTLDPKGLFSNDWLDDFFER